MPNQLLCNLFTNTQLERGIQWLDQMSIKQKINDRNLAQATKNR